MSARAAAVLAAVAVCVTVLPPATAGAAAPAAPGSTVATRPGGLLDFRAAAGQRNDVTVRYTGRFGTAEAPIRRFTLADVHPITPGTGCATTADSRHVTCDVVMGGLTKDDPASVRVFLGDGDDRADVRVGSQHDEVNGGSGEDRIVSLSYDFLTGGSGDDVIVGTSFADAGDGDDRVTLTGTGEGKILGGRGDDRLQGGAGPDTIFGNSGRDTIRGGRGGDDLLGGPDDDVVYGNSGNDGVYGGPGHDRLSGGPGTDTVRQDGPPRQGDQPNP